MNASAIGFFLFGAIVLWGGTAYCLSIALKKQNQ